MNRLCPNFYPLSTNPSDYPSPPFYAHPRRAPRPAPHRRAPRHAPRGRPRGSCPVAVWRDVPIAPPRHRRGARLGIPLPPPRHRRGPFAAPPHHIVRGGSPPRCLAAPLPRPSRATAALRLWGAIDGALAARPIPPSQAAWQVAHAESFAGGVSVCPLPPAGAPGPRRARRLFPPTTLFSPRANAPAAQESLDSNGTSALQFARFMHWNQSHVPKKIMESTNLYSIIVEHYEHR